MSINQKFIPRIASILNNIKILDNPILFSPLRQTEPMWVTCMKNRGATFFNEPISALMPGLTVTLNEKSFWQI